MNLQVHPRAPSQDYSKAAGRIRPATKAKGPKRQGQGLKAVFDFWALGV